MTSAPVRRAVAIVAVLNLAYFFVEGAVALRIGSTSLLADSADFFEDATVNFLIMMALGWSALARRRVGHALAFVLLLPAIAFLATLWSKFQHPLPPDAFSLSITGLGALVVNVGCALLLARVRHAHGSLTRAAFLSARNDAFANVGIIAAGLVTLFLPSIWPDIIVGLAIAWTNLDAAKEVWEAARSERDGAEPNA